MGLTRIEKRQGVLWTPEYSEFVVFSPGAGAVSVCIYQEADSPDGDYLVKQSLKAEGGELWKGRVEGDLEGRFYMYCISREGSEDVYARDPYAVAVGINGRRGAIVDLAKTNPEGFEKRKHIPLASPVDAVVCELHLRDFTMDEEIPFQHRGKFLGLVERGLKTREGKPAGLDALIELGVTHVQLLPIFDSAVVDESRVDDPAYTGRKYNWGYDPHNYNVPEGCYATDPADPAVRIRECKEMIAALHDAGIGVIMDVVYNHTYQVAEGPFEGTAPGYFYRMNGKSVANGSACGNEVASEKPMVRKYIKDSLKFWVQEYGVDGFRFDLMGLLDKETMRQVGEELREECHADILLYGEPWQAGGSPLPLKEQMLKGNQKGMGIGVFNDNLRDGLRGSTRGRDGGFALGRKGFEEEIAECLQGSIHTFASCPGESINYAGAHDDLNLWDKMITALGRRQAEGFLNMQDGRLKRGNLEKKLAEATLHHGITRENLWRDQAVRASVLSNATVLLSQGIPFFYAGDEILRSKYGDPNTYQSGDAINTIHWNDRDTFDGVFDFYRELIRIRREHPALRMNDRSLVEEKIRIHRAQKGEICFTIGEYANGDSWRYLCVFLHASGEEKGVQFPFEAKWINALRMPSAQDREADRLSPIDVQIWYCEE